MYNISYLFLSLKKLQKRPTPSKSQLNDVDVQEKSEDLFEVRQRYFLYNAEPHKSRST
jgi:hypothetical protein